MSSSHDPASVGLSTLSLHDALPILVGVSLVLSFRSRTAQGVTRSELILHSAKRSAILDRKSTRLNSSHRCISYAVFCLKKKRDSCGTLFTMVNGAICTVTTLTRDWS